MLYSVEHDLWIVSDEVYDEMLFEGVDFASPLGFLKGADRIVVVSSISKSHAAPGFRSGWSIGSKEFTKRLLPLAETMLFGNQPFIADMTAIALMKPSKVAADMRESMLSNGVQKALPERAFTVSTDKLGVVNGPF